MLLGIDIFLAMSLLTALLEDELPSPAQYLFQGAALLGLGQLFISRGFVDSGVFTKDPADPTRFWISVIYLASAVSNVVGLNAYLALVRHKIALATTFSGTVTVPTIMTSAFFITAFVGTGGEVGINAASLSILGIAAVISGLSVFKFLRLAAKHTSSSTATTSEHRFPGNPGIRSQTTGVSEKVASISLGAPSISLPLRLPTRQNTEWEESPVKSGEEEVN